MADNGTNAVADAGIFLVNKKLINAPCFSWWYGLIPEEKREKLYQTAASDWDNAPCPDVQVLFETDESTWLRFLSERGVPLIQFTNDYGSPENSARLLCEHLISETSYKKVLCK